MEFNANHKALEKELLIYINLLPGDYCKGVTPDPIPNSAVKPFSANGTLS
jgi:hypothetical protein